MALLDSVSEEQLNDRLMNAAGSDEPITRTRSVSFLSKNHSANASAFTMIRTPSSYGRARGYVIFNINDDGNGNQKHDRTERILGYP